MPADSSREAVVVLDRIGYNSYRSAAGISFLPADQYAVRLVTPLERLGEVHGAEIESVVGVAGHDIEPFARAARYQCCSSGDVTRRLVAITERLLLPAAALRDELGIPGAGMDETILFRDKLLMKAHLGERGVTVPESSSFSLSAAQELLRRHGRVVVKPVQGSGSAEIHVLTQPEQVDHFARHFEERLDEFEVEQFVTGKLYHVDGVVQNGEVIVATAGRYVDDTTSFRTLRPIRDVGVAEGPRLRILLDFNAEVTRKFPGLSGVTHTEIFLSPDGPVFCEIAVRTGGGGILAGFRARTGVNLDEVMVRAQLGQDILVPARPDERCTGFVALYGRPGIVRSTPRPPELSWITERQVLAGEGDVLSPPDRYADAAAIISVVGDSEEEVMNRLAEVARRTPIDIEETARSSGNGESRAD